MLGCEVLFLWCKGIHPMTLMELTESWQLQKHHGITTKLSIDMLKPCNSLHIDSVDADFITEMLCNNVI